MTDARRHYLELKQGEIQFQLQRLTEDEFRQLRSISLPIKNDDMFLFHLMLSEQNNPERLSLPKALLTLEYFLANPLIKLNLAEMALC